MKILYDFIVDAGDKPNQIRTGEELHAIIIRTIADEEDLQIAEGRDPWPPYSIQVDPHGDDEFLVTITEVIPR